MDTKTLTAMRAVLTAFIAPNQPKFGVYELIKLLEAQELFTNLPPSSVDLALFYKNFLVMHLLYGLCDDYAKKGFYLRICALDISLTTNTNAPLNRLADYSPQEQSLSEFYSELAHFYAATDENVNQLLTNFWQAYAKRETSTQALQTLDLPIDANWPDVQNAYRRLAQRHHPDKGGDPAFFAAISEAYAQLKIRFCNH